MHGPRAALDADPPAISALPSPSRSSAPTGSTSICARIDLLWAAFDAPATSRHLDVVARELQARGEGFYTIGSAGHESNALVALAARPTDPALLHYRSGGFYAARAGQVAGLDPDPRRAARADGSGRRADRRRPAQGVRPPRAGRHPADLDHRLPPATRGRAGHRPAAGRPARARAPSGRTDAIVVCSFGDASANHSTAAGAINTALNTAYRGLPVPILFVCEDNGYGISVPTPSGWIAAAYGQPARAGLLSRRRRRPGQTRGRRSPRRSTMPGRPGDRLFLHLRTVRFLAHAGSDAEISYRSPRAHRGRLRPRPPARPGPRAGRRRRRAGRASWTATTPLAPRSSRGRAGLSGEPRLGSATEVMAPLSPRGARLLVSARAVAVCGRRRSGPGRPRTLAESINATLADDPGADARTPWSSARTSGSRAGSTG